MLLVWCHLLTGYEPGLVRDNLRKVAPRPPLPVVQVHGEGVSPKGREFEPPSARTLYTCGSVAGRSRVRGSVRYITHDSYAISVVPPFNRHAICFLVDECRARFAVFADYVIKEQPAQTDNEFLAFIVMLDFQVVNIQFC